MQHGTQLSISSACKLGYMTNSAHNLDKHTGIDHSGHKGKTEENTAALGMTLSCEGTGGKENKSSATFFRCLMLAWINHGATAGS